MHEPLVGPPPPVFMAYFAEYWLTKGKPDPFLVPQWLRVHVGVIGEPTKWAFFFLGFSTSRKSTNNIHSALEFLWCLNVSGIHIDVLDLPCTAVRAFDNQTGFVLSQLKGVCKGATTGHVNGTFGHVSK